MTTHDPDQIRAAWAGRISGCLLGKPLEVLSFQQGHAGIEDYLRRADAWPLADYVPLVEDTVVAARRSSCRENLCRAEPDDDINYTVLALMLLEEYGPGFGRADVARCWLNRLPAGTTWTAERAAYACLLAHMDDEFVNGADPGFDLDECSANDFNDWIGAQIRADVYGWVCPDDPGRAADLAGRDASLSHRGEGILGARFIAALGAALPAARSLDSALATAMAQVPDTSAVAAAVRLGIEAADQADGMATIRARYKEMSPVHTVNNLALVVWALSAAGGSFDAAITRAVTAGWDTDSNAATVGGLMGISGATIDVRWTAPWAGRVATDIAGCSELCLEDLVLRTLAVARSLENG